VDHRLAELTRIYVLPAEQRQGVGFALLDQAFATARERGVREVSVAVARGNDKGRAFYERNGFKPSGERTIELFGAHVQELKYSRQL
jgi:ribosomal protein S18 acetylase RimI-like enzyme